MSFYAEILMNLWDIKVYLIIFSKGLYNNIISSFIIQNIQNYDLLSYFCIFIFSEGNLGSDTGRNIFVIACMHWYDVNLPYPPKTVTLPLLRVYFFKPFIIVNLSRLVRKPYSRLQYPDFLTIAISEIDEVFISLFLLCISYEMTGTTKVIMPEFVGSNI